MNVAFVGFTFIDEPDPPLTYQLILYHIFNMLKTNNTHIGDWLNPKSIYLSKKMNIVSKREAR